MQTVDPQHAAPDDTTPGTRLVTRFALGVLFALFATFWIWALFFASKEAVNKIDDRAWAERAQQICLRATEDRIALADLRPIGDGGAELIRERADIVDSATDVLEQMVDDVVAVVPTDEKGRAIVPLWEADYRTYLQNRRDFTDRLRETGENQAFYESKTDAIPISERIATFAGDNEMAACSPPFDLSR